MGRKTPWKVAIFRNCTVDERDEIDLKTVLVKIFDGSASNHSSFIVRSSSLLTRFVEHARPDAFDLVVADQAHDHLANGVTKNPLHPCPRPVASSPGDRGGRKPPPC